MSEYLMRTSALDRPPEAGDALLLDWSPGRREGTVHTGDSAPAFFSGLHIPHPAEDLLLFGCAVYCIDKTARRAAQTDAWTRALTLRLPVRDVDAWADASWSDALNFLSGDLWTIDPFNSKFDPLAGLTSGETMAPADVVCLFSGGLDSLCGAIDLLEEDDTRRVCLVSHHEAGPRQSRPVGL